MLMKGLTQQNTLMFQAQTESRSERDLPSFSCYLREKTTQNNVAFEKSFHSVGPAAAQQGGSPSATVVLVSAPRLATL